MANEQNLTFVLGEDWEIAFALNDAAGADLDITGGEVAFRLSRRRVEAMLLTTAGSDISIESPSIGLGSIAVTPPDQSAAGIYAAVWDYEVRATLADGRVTTQAFGQITVEPSLFPV